MEGKAITSKYAGKPFCARTEGVGNKMADVETSREFLFAEANDEKNLRNLPPRRMQCEANRKEKHSVGLQLRS